MDESRPGFDAPGAVRASESVRMIPWLGDVQRNGQAPWVQLKHVDHFAQVIVLTVTAADHHIGIDVNNVISRATLETRDDGRQLRTIGRVGVGCLDGEPSIQKRFHSLDV